MSLLFNLRYSIVICQSFKIIINCFCLQKTNFDFNYRLQTRIQV